jgi:hypothetical protein
MEQGAKSIGHRAKSIAQSVKSEEGEKRIKRP